MKTKDNYKDFIDNHRNEFDDEMPSENLWNKLNEGLEKESKKQASKSYALKYTLRIAAAVAVVLASYFFFTIIHSRNDVQYSQQHQVNENNETSELVEAEAYYTSQVNIRKQEVFKLMGNQPEVKQDIINDFSELESEYIELKKELKENVSNEQVVAAMIQNYRMRLEILENLLMRLDKSNNTSSIRKEKTYEL